jgi:hypothetical protein
MAVRTMLALGIAAVLLGCAACDEAVDQQAGTTATSASISAVTTVSSHPPSTAVLGANTRLRSATYVCGPADGAYIEVAIDGRLPPSVILELVTADSEQRSEPSSPDLTGVAGFDIDLTPAEYHGATAEVRVYDAAEPSTALDARPVRLRLPPGVGCG